MISDNFRHLRSRVSSQLRKPNKNNRQLTDICLNSQQNQQTSKMQQLTNKIEDKIRNINFFKGEQARRKTRHNQQKEQLIATNSKTIQNLKALISLEEQKNFYLMEKLEKWKKKQISVLQLSFGASTYKIIDD